MSGAMLLDPRERAHSQSFDRYITEYMIRDDEFMDGVRRGIVDWREGRVTPWKELRSRLGLDDDS